MVALLPNAKQQFFDASGAPLVGGKVYTYLPGTSTPVTTFSDYLGTQANTNPVILDSAGRASIYGNGPVRQIVNDYAGNLIYDAVTIAAATVGGGATAYTNQTGNRVLSTLYINNTGRPLFVSVEINATTSGNLTLTVGAFGSFGQSVTGPAFASAVAIIPPGASYGAGYSGTATIQAWIEY